jgi:hypothetical protein
MADHIYKGQPWTAYLDTETDLTSATLKIRVKSPSGVITLLDATQSVTPDTEIYAKITGAINNEVGKWDVRPWVLFSGDTEYTPGYPLMQRVEDL